MHGISHLPRHDTHDHIRAGRRDIVQPRRHMLRMEDNLLAECYLWRWGRKMRTHEYAKEVQGGVTEGWEFRVGCHRLAIHARCGR
jgi:hypothetical protein